MRRRLYLEDVAEYIGVRSISTVNAYRARRNAGFPDPDGTDIDRGHARPWWWESTIEEWHANRPGRGNWKSRHARAARS